MNKITKWLNTKDFEEGTALYEQYGTNKVLLAWYQKGKNSAAEKSLLAELKKLETIAEVIDEQVKKPIQKVYTTNLHILSTAKDKRMAKEKAATVSKSVLPSDADDAPEEVKNIVQRRKFLFSQVNRYHAILCQERNDVQRAALAIKLMLAWDEIEVLWRKTQHYDKHRELPVELPKVDIEIASGESLTKRLLTLRSYRSKCQKGILKAERLPEIEAEINEIELILEGLEDETKQHDNNQKS